MFKFLTNLFKSDKSTTSKEGTSTSSKRSTVTNSKEGTVKFFNRRKGFGFITIKDSNEEIFVHKSNLVDPIRDKDKVTFNIEDSDKGPTAANVKVVKR